MSAISKEVDVTQADRDRAADWYRANGTRPMSAAMRRGDLDKHSLVQAFARHRIASLSTHKAAPVSDGVVERVARALFPNEWHEIDRRRKAAQCYRDTPHEKAGFESPEAAEKFASEYEAAADRSAEWALGIAARGLKASGLDEAIEALDLAANRLARCSLEPKYGTAQRYEWQEWADEARTVADKLRSAS